MILMKMVFIHVPLINHLMYANSFNFSASRRGISWKVEEVPIVHYKVFRQPSNNLSLDGRVLMVTSFGELPELIICVAHTLY